MNFHLGKIRPCIIVTNDVYNQRVPVIQAVPITAWSAKKAKIVTNVEINSTRSNGLSKKSVADCIAHGNSHEDALANAKEAIHLWIDTAEEFGDPVPTPKGQRLMLA